MAHQASRHDFENNFARSETLDRKKASAAKGKVIKAPVDPERARFDALLRKVQKSRDEANLKR